MTADDYREFLLENIPSARPASGSRFVLCRCFECGDSKDPTHAHMYISIPQDDDDLSFAYCHKCKMHVTITPDVLTKWGLTNSPQIFDWLIQHNKTVFANPSNKIYLNRSVYALNNIFIQDTELSDIKLKYINARLGTNLTRMDALQLKIVLNLEDLLYSNNIEQLTRDPSIVDQLNDNFVGFISSDNAFVNCRRIVKEGIVYKSIDKRYIRYNIFGKYDNTEKFYTVPANINTSTSERIKVNISEGEFDILSVYLNLRKDPNQIYMSIGGSGYVGLMRYILTKLKLVYIELHLYPDNDPTGQEELEYVRELLRPYLIPIYIHRNLMPGEKDFGVPLDRIQESVELLI